MKIQSMTTTQIEVFLSSHGKVSFSNNEVKLTEQFPDSKLETCHIYFIAGFIRFVITMSNAIAINTYF